MGDKYNGRSLPDPNLRKNGLLIVFIILLLMNLFLKFTDSMVSEGSKTEKTMTSTETEETTTRIPTPATAITNTNTNTNTPEDGSNPLAQLELPANITTIFFNIGSNLDPILPPPEFGDTAITIAVEPIVGCKIVPHKQIMVVHAAVAASSGLTSMFIYNHNGVSSSLSKPILKDHWNINEKRGDGSIHLVPVITLKQILDAIPSHISIPYLITDMQGYDFAAIEAAQEALFEKKVDFVYSELFFSNPHYFGPKNDFCTEWWPHMKKMRYELMYVETPNKGTLKEESVPEYCASGYKASGAKYGNALWKRQGAEDHAWNFDRH